MKKKTKVEPAHVVFEGEDIFCRHCGEREKVFPMPVSEKRIAAFKLIVEDFQETHAACEETAESPSKASLLSPDAWLHGGDAGISSMTIWHVALGRPFPIRALPNVPLDPDDFGRCVRLLQAFPWMREKLPAVAEKYPAWKPLVERWTELEALYAEELPTGTAPKLYALMRKLQGRAPLEECTR